MTTAPALYPPIQKDAAVHRKAALFGGVYNNHLALETACRMAADRGCDALWQMGDLGGFGPNPDKVFPILRKYGVRCIQGNYEESLVARASDCGCGYTHPKDNHYAALSYDYTDQHISDENRAWLATLPKQAQVRVGGLTLHLCHGSPRRINEFLWETTTSDGFIASLARDLKFNVLCCTHSGLPWSRAVAPGVWALNVGVLGRPANDGTQNVWYAEVSETSGRPKIELVKVDYDWQALAAEMAEEKLPQEFIDTITTGWWTTCLEILPGKERARGRF
ncbi:MAG: metallophosphoesterase family protein [Elusimicrobia bacterium]|nr:metallophosphoesterase family protein [Elusimicrobiota bacterium]